MKRDPSGQLPLTLRVYRNAVAVFGPLAWVLLRLRKMRGKEDPVRHAERRGIAGRTRPIGPVIWLHGASVGETVSAMPIAQRLSARGFTVLITSGTVTSAAVIAHRLPPGAIHQYVPLDTPQHVRRFLDTWQPALAIFVESELWPNMIAEVHARRTPLVLVNGRMSERSFRRWRMAPRTIAALIGRFDLCLAQSADDARRFDALGAARVTVTGNLKFDALPPPIDPATAITMRRAIGHRRVFVAASTHPGEDAFVFDAHHRMRDNIPGLITIIVPRHPERGAAIMAESLSRGFNTLQRSTGDEPERSTEVYVADTIGELGVFYSLARVALVGGSLVPHGGQNPIEPAKLECAILHGPHIRNFAEVYEALDTAGGANLVIDAEDLAIEASVLLLKGVDEPRPMIEAATRVVTSLSGALDRTMSAIEPYLLQIALEQR